MENKNFEYKTVFMIKNVSKNGFLAPSGNPVIENVTYEEKNGSLSAKENRACFNTEKEALDFIAELDFEDLYKIFDKLEITKGVTIKI